MIEWGSFVSHSGLRLPFKVNCDSFTDENWAACAQIVWSRFAFSRVIGVPRGGLKFAEACKPFCGEGYPILIVDDVLTTGCSMEEMKANFPLDRVIGVVVVARGPFPNWIWPMFILQDWARCRGTGTG